MLVVARRVDAAGMRVESGDQAAVWETVLGCSDGCMSLAPQICPPSFPVILSTSDISLCRLQPGVPLPSDFQWEAPQGLQRKRELEMFIPSAPSQPPGFITGSLCPSTQSCRTCQKASPHPSSRILIPFPLLSLPGLRRYQKRLLLASGHCTPGPCVFKTIPLLNSSQITQFAYAICFLLGSLLIQKERGKI